MDSKRLVIIAQQGSGTNLVRSLLNSHPDILLYDELMVSRRDGGSEYQTQPLDNPKSFLDEFFAIQHDKKVYGFDLKYNQITDGLLQYFKDNGWYVLHLYRDPMRSFFQPIVDNTRTFTLTDVARHVEYVREKSKMVADFFKDYPFYLDERYENITRGDEITENGSIDTLSWILVALGVEDQWLKLSGREVSKKTIKRFHV